MPRRTLLLALALCAASWLAGCSGQGAGGGGSSQPSTAPEGDRPDITLDTVREAINGEWVRAGNVEDEKDTRDWTFVRDEPKEINIVEKQFDGDRAKVTIDMKTRSAPWDVEKPLSLEGRLRLHMELENGLVLRKWEIENVENISFKFRKEYKEGPAPPPNSDDGEPARTPAPNQPSNNRPANRQPADEPPAAGGPRAAAHRP